MQVLSVKIVKVIFLWALFVGLRGMVKINAASNGPVDSFVFVQDDCKLISEKLAHETYQQLATTLKKELEQKGITLDQAYNGLATLGLKNSEKVVCVFLGVVSALGLMLMVKVFSMLMASEEKERPVSLMGSEGLDHRVPSDRGSTPSPVALLPERQPNARPRQNEQQPRGPQPMLVHFDGQLRFNGQEDARSVAPLVPQPM
jgi:hypothetical protein